MHIPSSIRLVNIWLGSYLLQSQRRIKNTISGEDRGLGAEKRSGPFLLMRYTCPLCEDQEEGTEEQSVVSPRASHSLNRESRDAERQDQADEHAVASICLDRIDRC